MNDTSPLDAALSYAARGWFVLPLHTPIEVSKAYPSGCDCRKVCEDVGKHPRTRNGVKDSSIDEAQIRKWWTMFPTANVAIDLAKSGLLDVAPDDSGWHAEFIARGLPSTLTFASGGGDGHLHFLYALPDGVPQARACRSGEYDIMSAGYAVMPPSLHQSGNSYLWLRDQVALAEPLPWMCEMLRDRPKGRERPSSDPGGEVVRDEAFNRVLESVDMRAWDGTLFENDRSKGLVAIAGELAQAGCNEATILHYLNERDVSLGWNKYADRTDRDVRYEELALAALERAAEQPPRLRLATATVTNGAAHQVEDFDAVPLGAFPEPPLDILPPLLQDIIAAGSLPPALMMGAFLGALATAIGGLSEVVLLDADEERSTWRERQIFFVPLLAPPGAGKSPAANYAYLPIEREDDRRRQHYEEEHARWQDDIAGLKAAKATAAEIRDHPEPRDLSKLIQDITAEGLCRQLRDQPSGGLQPDELGLALGGLGEYKRDAVSDTARWLAMWEGKRISYTRVGGGTKSGKNAVKIVVPRPTVVVCGSLQLERVGLLGKDADGMRPRWLPHVHGERVEREIRLVPRSLTDQYHALALKLLERDHIAREWLVTAAVRRRFNEIAGEWKDRSQAIDCPPSVAGALRKADKHLLRFAGWFAEVNLGTLQRDVDLDLPMYALDNGAKWAEYTFACWNALPMVDGLVLHPSDREKDAAVVKLISYLDRVGGEVTAKSLIKNGVAGMKTAVQRDAIVARFQAQFPFAVRIEKLAGGGNATVWLRSPRAST